MSPSFSSMQLTQLPKVIVAKRAHNAYRAEGEGVMLPGSCPHDTSPFVLL